MIKIWTKFYIEAVKISYQNKYKSCSLELNNFINKNSKSAKIIWGNCLNVMKDLKSESIDCMVTSPPYYNARSYSHWENLNDYLEDMRKIIKESYRVFV